MDGGLDEDVLQQRLKSVAAQREEIQQLEIELTAKLIARNEIIEVKNNYESQLNNHTSATVKLQDQLLERDRRIHDLETKIEEKDKEVHDIKLANQAAWAKEDLIREQNKELANFRLEMNISEAERVKNRKQLHDLQERSKEKERQFIELQEQNKAAQETIIFKEDQLREAQSWISHIQEMDSMQSSTIHSLQAELRERTEQYNQLWLGCQKQFAEMESFHLHVVQQLQMGDSREINGITADNSCMDDENENSVVQFGHNNGNQPDVSEVGTSGLTIVPCAETAENISSLSSTSNKPIQVNEPVDKCIISVKKQESGGHISSSEHHGMDNCEVNINSHIQESEKTKSLPTLSSSESSGLLEENKTTINIANSSAPPVPSVPVITSIPATSRTTEVTLLDERSLLASIVRTMPPGSGGRVHISSTLPNRLGKVLAPLSWHDYKRKYGNLCDFVAGHPELFLIEGDHIQLQDGAKEIIAATSAVAKVAAAASVPSSLLHNVSVTPMAHNKMKDVTKPISGFQLNHNNDVCVKFSGNNKDDKTNGLRIDNKMNAKTNVSSRVRVDHNGLVQDRRIVNGRIAAAADLSLQHQRRRAGVSGKCKQ